MGDNCHFDEFCKTQHETHEHASKNSRTNTLRMDMATRWFLDGLATQPSAVETSPLSVALGEFFLASFLAVEVQRGALRERAGEEEEEEEEEEEGEEEEEEEEGGKNIKTCKHLGSWAVSCLTQTMTPRCSGRVVLF